MSDGRFYFEVYQDAGREWRWRLVSGNGRIVCDSAESFTRAEDAERSVALIRENAITARVEREA